MLKQPGQRGDNIDIDELKAWTGHTETANDWLSSSLSARFKATLGQWLLSSTPVPWGIHWCATLPAVEPDALGEDGHPRRGGFLPPVALPRRMWAGSDVQFLAPLLIEEAITRRSTVADIQYKQSPRTGDLVFVSVQHEYLQCDTCRITELQTLVYRNASPYREAETPRAVKATPTAVCTPDSTLLFRYSALTFNGHRIHYDKPYAIEREQYPGLLVHGPLMATLLMHAAQRQRGDAPLRRFTFRGQAPAFAGESLAIVHREQALDESATEWEIHGPGQRLVMSAKAEF